MREANLSHEADRWERDMRANASANPLRSALLCIGVMAVTVYVLALVIL